MTTEIPRGTETERDSEIEELNSLVVKLRELNLQGNLTKGEKEILMSAVHITRAVWLELLLRVNREGLVQVQTPFQRNGTRSRS
jgi:hypothetical protein